MIENTAFQVLLQNGALKSSNEPRYFELPSSLCLSSTSLSSSSKCILRRETTSRRASVAGPVSSGGVPTVSKALVGEAREKASPRKRANQAHPPVKLITGIVCLYTIALAKNLISPEFDS